MKGTEIVLDAEPRGHFEECIVYGTPKPGTVMELKAAALASGRATYQAATRTTGGKGAVAVLCADHLQGKGHSDAYVSGTRGFLYWPIAGEELNMLVADVSGTADDVAIGDLFGVETVTGKLKANSSYASTPFQAMEVITDPIADYWLFCKYLGNNA